MYRRDGTTAPIFSTYVGYYDRQTGGRTIHSPKNCLPGSGWEPRESSTLAVQTATGPATVNRYLVQNGSQLALVLYWYQGRERVAHNEYMVKWHLIRDAVRWRRTEEALARIVVAVGSAEDEISNIQKAEALAIQVAERLIPELSEALPPLSSQKQ